MYIQTFLLALASPILFLPQAAAEFNCRVEGSNVNIRTCASTGCESIGQHPEGNWVAFECGVKAERYYYEKDQWVDYWYKDVNGWYTTVAYLRDCDDFAYCH